MPTTTRLALPYPASTDPADVPADIQALADALDTAVLYTQGTEASRPAAGVQGKVYWATDTATMWIDNGTAWVPVGIPAQDGSASTPGMRFAADTNTGIYRPGADRLGFATAGAKALEVAADGKVLFGDATDTNLYRSAADTLRTDDSLVVGGTLTVGSDPVSPLPIGAIQAYAGATAPGGWLMCDGAAVSRTTYSGLFAVLGITYGAGNGSTTFNIPDMRGRTPSGKDDMGGTPASRLTSGSGGVDGATLGAAGGSQAHTLTSAQMPSHDHAVGMYDPGHYHGAISYGGSGGGPPGPSASWTVGGASDGSTTTFGNTGQTTTGVRVLTDGKWDYSRNTGGGGAHPNVQPTIVMNYLIKT